MKGSFAKIPLLAIICLAAYAITKDVRIIFITLGLAAIILACSLEWLYIRKRGTMLEVYGTLKEITKVESGLGKVKANDYRFLCSDDDGQEFDVYVSGMPALQDSDSRALVVDATYCLVYTDLKANAAIQLGGPERTYRTAPKTIHRTRSVAGV